MKAKLGSIVTEASGSLGGHTFQNSKGGFQIRNKPIPRTNPSPAQTLIRSYNPLLQAGWRSLTPAQQKIWNEWPISHGIMNAKGDKSPLSGHSLWMKYNFEYYKAAGFCMVNPWDSGPPYLGPELVDQSLWCAPGLAYWNFVGAGWAGDGLTLYDHSGNWQPLFTLNIMLSIGNLYKVSITKASGNYAEIWMQSFKGWTFSDDGLNHYWIQDGQNNYFQFKAPDIVLSSFSIKRCTL